MFITKLFFKIKRFLFKRLTGLNPEEVRKLVYVQKYLEHNNRSKIKSYNEYLKENFKNASQCK